jgi:hypothetical protein
MIVDDAQTAPAAFAAPGVCPARLSNQWFPASGLLVAGYLRVPLHATVMVIIEVIAKTPSESRGFKEFHLISSIRY